MTKGPEDLIDCMARMKGEEQPFAVATVVHVAGGASAGSYRKTLAEIDAVCPGSLGGLQDALDELRQHPVP